jgi:hypothetical protein
MSGVIPLTNGFIHWWFGKKNSDNGFNRFKISIF